MSTTTDYFDLLRTNLEGVAEAWEGAARFWEDAARQWSDGPSGAFVPMGDLWTSAPDDPSPSGSRRGGGCRCGATARRPQRQHEHGGAHREPECGCGKSTEDCCQDACRCCVPDADVVLHTGVGESRVVPFRVTNSWRRPREVTLAIGEWQVCQGEVVAVRAAFGADQKFVLEPCSDRVVRLLVEIPREVNNSKDADGPKGRERLSDVGSCTSLYADLRFEGCSRPQRIAVVIHPADCVAIGVGCDCGCCG